MSIKDYLKQRWYLFAILSVAGIFSYLVGWASGAQQSYDYAYIVQGIAICFAVFVAVDYMKLNTRIKRMNEFLDNNCTKDMRSNYPLDIKYAEKMKQIVDAHNKYKEQTQTEHNRELEFITKWVHDVKVPISAVKLLVENMDNDEAQHIEMQLSYIDQNIQKILYHMKSKRFYDDYRIKQSSIKSIVNQALKNYAVFFAYKSISLKIDCQDYSVYTDEKWSMYVISQLISNAIKYTNNNGEITISTHKCDDEVKLSVKNTGQGIKQSNIKNIFRQGYTGSMERKEKSTGYGLYLAKKLLDKMGHSISVKAEEGQYAKFTITYKTDEESEHYKSVSYDD